MTKVKSWIPMLFMLALTVAGFGLEGLAQQAPASHVAGTLVYGQPFPPSALDPGRANVDNQTLKVIMNTYDSLIAYKYGTTQIVPDLATSWTSTDNQTWTFHLRQGVTFHDGAPFTSQDVLYSVNRIGKLGLPLASVTDAISSIEAPGPYTVVVTLKQPQAYFLDDFSQIFIINAKQAEAHQQNGDMGHAWLANHDAGTGPYELTSWNHNQQMVLTYFPNYWQGWAGNHVKEVKILFVNNSATQQEMLQSGQLDFMAITFPNLASKIKQNPAAYPNLKLYTAVSYRTDMLAFNTLRKPLDDPRVRLAISYAFPYAQYAKQATYGFGVVPHGLIPPGFPGFDNAIPPQTMNMAEAKKLLAEAGYPNGGFQLSLDYAAPQTSERDAGLLLQNNLQTLGIKVTLHPTPWPIMVQEAGKGKDGPDMFAVQTVAPNANPIYYISHFFGPSASINWSQYDNPTLQNLLSEASQASSSQERDSYLSQAEEILVKDAPALYYGNPGKYELVNAKVQGFEPDPVFYWLIDFYRVSLSQ